MRHFRLSPLKTMLVTGVGLLLFLGSGCAFFKKSNELVKPTIILPFSNQTDEIFNGLVPEFQRRIHQYLEDECSHTVRFLTEKDLVYPSIPSTNKSTDDPYKQFALSILENNYDSGINAVITGKLLHIGLTKKQSGLLWFKKDKSVIELIVTITVYDTLTGSKIFDENFQEDIESELYETDQLLDSESIPPALIEDSLRDMAQKVGKALCKHMSSVYWHGFVKGVEGNTVIISAGEGSGLKKGRILWVHCKNDQVKGLDDRVFLAPGHVDGRLRVTAVQGNEVICEIIEGETIAPGCFVTSWK